MLHFKKDQIITNPKVPSVWKANTRSTEAKLSAALTSAVSNEIMQTAVAISQGFGDTHLEDERANATEYPMSLIIVYSILDHIKPSTTEIRKILTTYIRSPPYHEEAGNARAEVVWWKRAQRQARASNIEKLSPSE